AHGVGPAQQDVARRLDQPLPGHHPAALVLARLTARVGGEHGLLRLLGLQQQRVVVVPPSSSTIQQRVPTLPTPTTFRAMSTTWYRPSRYRRSEDRERTYPWRTPRRPCRSAAGSSSRSPSGTSNGGSGAMRRPSAVTRVSFVYA